MLSSCSKSPQYVVRRLHQRETKTMTSEVIRGQGSHGTPLMLQSTTWALSFTRKMGEPRTSYARYTVRQVSALLLYNIGEYPSHRHDTTDDFYVLEGEMEMDIEGEPPCTIKAGELFVVPKGVVHRPRAKNEVKVLLI